MDVDIGKVRKEQYIEDSKLMERFKQKYELSENFQIVFTDGSFQEKNRSTGVGIVLDEIRYRILYEYRQKMLNLYSGSINYRKSYELYFRKCKKQRYLNPN